MSAGPLHDVRVIELAGIGPAPFAAMILAGLGATVVRIDRATAAAGRFDPELGLVNRGRPSIAVDLRNPLGVDVVQRLADQADVLIEPFRPGVTERLGLGPDVLMDRNPRLVYARMTGWGQDGPNAQAVGHDINYIAVSGALHSIGTADSGPVPPLNLIGDFAGGSMPLVYGILAALLERERSGRGQVIDAAMVDGVAMIMTAIYDLHNNNEHTDDRGSNLLDGGAPFYGTYECADARWIAVGAIEPSFFAAFERLLGLGDLGDQWDQQRWPEVRKTIAEQIRTRRRDEWLRVFADSDACVTPVRTIAEVPDDAQIAARGSVTRRADGTLDSALAPRFSRTPTSALSAAAAVGGDTRSALADWGFTPSEIAEFEKAGAVRQHSHDDVQLRSSSATCPDPADDDSDRQDPTWVGPGFPGFGLDLTT